MSTDTLTAEAIVDSQMREWERVGIDLQEPDRRDTLLGLARAARQPLEERVRELEAELRHIREGSLTAHAASVCPYLGWVVDRVDAALPEPVR